MNPDIKIALETAATETGIPYALIESVSYYESRHDPHAESPAGAKGLMQIMPINFDAYGITDPFDPLQSARAGAKIIKKYTKKFTSIKNALAAYVWGPQNVSKKTEWPDKVKKYVEKVLDRYYKNLSDREKKKLIFEHTTFTILLFWFPLEQQ